MKKWFAAKRYGWGWVPVTWQGWLVLAVYILGLLWLYLPIEKYKATFTTQEAIIYLTIPTILWTIALLMICYLTGEEPRWRWGK